MWYHKSDRECLPDQMHRNQRASLNGGSHPFLWRFISGEIGIAFRKLLALVVYLAGKRGDEPALIVVLDGDTDVRIAVKKGHSDFLCDDGIAAAAHILDEPLCRAVIVEIVYARVCAEQKGQCAQYNYRDPACCLAHLCLSFLFSLYTICLLSCG